MKPPDSVVIVMLSALGDAVHVLPVINALKREWPDTHITWIVQPATHRLVANHPAVDEFVIFQRRRGVDAIKSYRELRAALRGRRFDLLINLQVYFKAGLITALVKADVKLGFDRKRARDMNWLFTNQRIAARPGGHVQDQYFEFLQHLGIDPQPIEWKLGPWPNDPTIDHLLPPDDSQYVTLVIGSTKPEKDWIAERWAQLSDRLVEEFGLTPVLAGGNSPSERATERIILEQALHKPISTLGCSLRELVGILHRSALVISLDSGPMHMAVALNTPVIALSGYNDARRVGPYRRFNILTVNAFGEDGPITHKHRQGRMQTIEVPDVIAKVKLWQERYDERRSRKSNP